MSSTTQQHTPAPKVFFEKIGDTEYEIEDAKLDVFNDIVLWDQNPRLTPYISTSEIHSDEDLETKLKDTPGYAGLRRSIADIGQQEHVYVWKTEEMGKYRVLEGASRVTILREIARRKEGQPDESKFRTVKAKILPPHFPLEHVVILLAKIHVRGAGVRSWGRYVEAKFIYDHTEPRDGAKALMSVASLAQWLGKSVSWISRLRDAYKFAREFVEYLDSPDAENKAFHEFSTLEEIVKSSGFGPRLKGESAEAVALRSEVFDMVNKEVFTEYRDARFMREFFDDPEKWERLKTHEKGIAHKLATEVKGGTSNLRARVGNLHAQIQRTLEGEPAALSVDDHESLQKAADLLGSHVAADLGVFRLKLQSFVKALHQATLEEILKVTEDEYGQLQTGLADFNSRLENHAPWMKSKGKDS
jgi:hypothetical protein